MARTETQFSDVQSILCLGATADDIGISYGKSMLVVAVADNSGRRLSCFSALNGRTEEAATGARLDLGDDRQQTVLVENYEDSLFPAIGMASSRHSSASAATCLRPRVYASPGRPAPGPSRNSELTWCTFEIISILNGNLPKYEEAGPPQLVCAAGRRSASGRLRRCPGLPLPR